MEVTVISFTLLVPQRKARPTGTQ